MIPPELSESDATIWIVTHELSITTLEASFTLIYVVYSSSIICDDHELTIVICWLYRTQFLLSEHQKKFYDIDFRWTMDTDDLLNFKFVDFI